MWQGLVFAEQAFELQDDGVPYLGHGAVERIFLREAAGQIGDDNA